MNKKVIIFFVTIILVFATVGNKVFAEDNIVDEGQVGTSNWILYDSGLLEINHGEFNEYDLEFSPWIEYSSQISTIKFTDKVIGGKVLAGLFYGLRNLETIINIEFLDTSNTMMLDYVFTDCISLKELDLSKWNVDNVASTTSMFLNTPSLRKLDISGWNSRDVSSASSMFFTTYSGRNTLEMLILGENSVFAASDTHLQVIDNNNTRYTGRWVGLNTSNTYESSLVFIQEYYENPIPDTYVWEAVNKVDFNSNGGTEVPSQEVLTTKTIVEPQTIEKEGYIFKGWYTEEDILWNFDNIVTEDMSLHAKWAEPINESKIIINYKDELGVEISDREEVTGEVGTMYEVEIKEIEGYTFVSIQFPEFSVNEDNKIQFLEDSQVVDVIYSENRDIENSTEPEDETNPEKTTELKDKVESTSSKLPKTGIANNNIIMLFGVVSATIGAIVLISKKRV